MSADSHVHLFPPDFAAERAALMDVEPTFAELYRDPRTALGTAEELLEHMEREGVERAVICGFAWRDPDRCARHNDYLLDTAARSGGRLLPFCTVNPAAGRAALDEAERCARAGARGLGELRPDDQSWRLDDPSMSEGLAHLAAAHGLTLLVHVSEPVGHAYPGKGGCRPESFMAFAERYPAVTLIGAHLGGGLPFYAHMPEVARALRRSCYFDTAACHLLYEPTSLRHAVAVLGADRFLLGSDWPLASHARARRWVEAAGLAPGEQEAIIAGNLLRVLER